MTQQPSQTTPNTSNSQSKRSGPSGTGSSKKQKLINLLVRKSGADTKTISTRLGWQAHTIRAAISGLRKDGYSVEVVPASGKAATRYRISDAAPTEAES
jgi:predicted ArsR family transcriptional regulator